jgi:hypothetical protein
MYEAIYFFGVKCGSYTSALTSDSLAMRSRLIIRNNKWRRLALVSNYSELVMVNEHWSLLVTYKFPYGLTKQQNVL